MGIPGSYLVLRIAGEDVAESVSVSLKVKARKMDTTTQDSGMNGSYMPGRVRIRISGAFLLATDGANWDRLYGYVGGDEIGVAYYRDGVQFFDGYGKMKRLSTRGADSAEKVTGSYSIQYYVTPVEVEQAILTEAGLTLTTEDGKTLIIE